MKNRLNEKTVNVLEILNESSSPLGSWNLADRLESRKIPVSYATVGRLLSFLEHAGYVRKVGNNGRCITDAGRDALQAYYVSNNMDDQKDILESVVLGKDLDNFISVLQARRAIESETAWLAAGNITDAEIAHLQSILDGVRLDPDNPETVARGDVEFHMGIAKASGNKILVTLYSMLFPYGQQTATFAIIRQKFNYSSPHQSILDALKDHDADLAELRMVKHIDSLISGLIACREDFVGEAGH